MNIELLVGLGVIVGVSNLFILLVLINKVTKLEDFVKNINKKVLTDNINISKLAKILGSLDSKVNKKEEVNLN
jgi:HAMP domain-containing protein|tara:strand:+ start:2833 stop:3051 length:219 start_codon:yes stop_codon:yes gene_type:complete